MLTNPSSVLVVDDDREWLESMTEALQSEGYAVTAAASGTQALSILDHLVPNVVITDLRMPLMGGEALLAALRTLHPEIPVVVVSGERPNPNTVGLELAFEVLEKPTSLARLLAVVADASQSGLRTKSV
jgi:two-component system, NtrC family, C4-dicarboxylate transport response regulator DctD